MKIEISDDRTIGELKKKFNDEFPFLHLEFFSGKNEKGIQNPLQKIVDETKTLKSLRRIHNEGKFVFAGEDKVSTIEKTLMDKFGLTVQIFRKSGNQWLLTTATDDFSLNEQDMLGKEMSTSIAAAEPDDIHEQE